MACLSAASLSSHTQLVFEVSSRFNLQRSVISLISFILPTSSRIPIDNAIYSVSILESAISVYNLDDHVTETPPSGSTHPVLFLTLIGFSLSSNANNPAKSAWTYKSNPYFGFGVITIPLSVSPFR